MRKLRNLSNALITPFNIICMISYLRKKLHCVCLVMPYTYCSRMSEFNEDFSLICYIAATCDITFSATLQAKHVSFTYNTDRVLLFTLMFTWIKNIPRYLQKTNIKCFLKYFKTLILFYLSC